MFLQQYLLRAMVYLKFVTCFQTGGNAFILLFQILEFLHDLSIEINFTKFTLYLLNGLNDSR